jgi:hypothetical protein
MCWQPHNPCHYNQSSSSSCAGRGVQHRSSLVPVHDLLLLLSVQRSRKRRNF